MHCSFTVQGRGTRPHEDTVTVRNRSSRGRAAPQLPEKRRESRPLTGESRVVVSDDLARTFRAGADRAERSALGRPS